MLPASIQTLELIVGIAERLPGTLHMYQKSILIKKIEELIDELRQKYTIAIVTHSMQQAARGSQRTA